MRFRTKIFLGWVVVTLGFWAGAFLAMRRSVEQSFDQMADETFVGIHRGLHQLYAERVSSMRNACDLIADIPELRALIAEQNYELSAENQASLRERLDYVNQVVGATFVYAANKSGQPVAMSEHAPWTNLADLAEFLKTSKAAHGFVQATIQPKSRGANGVWVHHGAMYELAAAPLLFQGDATASPEGVLVMGKRMTDAFADELGKSYGCDISFLSSGGVAASSLAAPMQEQLTHTLGAADVTASTLSEAEFQGERYRIAAEPLIDPCSATQVGTLVIHQNQANAHNFLWNVLRSLIATTVGGIIAAGLASYLLSLMISKPVHELVTGVREVALGNLEFEFKASGRDELAELGRAFNDMVSRLSHSRNEMQRLLDEAQRSAQREHLLRDVAQQINQRLDVQSALVMFFNSARDLFPDVQLAVYGFDAERNQLTSFHQPMSAADQPPAPAPPAIAAYFARPAALEQLNQHKLLYLPHVPAEDVLVDSRHATVEGASTCLAPMQAEQKLLGIVTATRCRPDGFSSDERDFLQALADHFAIALANGQLYAELQKAYRDLNANQQQIIQTERLRAVGQMASGIAHDFNNHLTGVLGFLELSLDREDLDEELRTWLEMSRESSLAAASVVTLLRTFYRRDNTVSHEPVDINKLISSTIMLTKPRWSDMPRQHGLDVRIIEDLQEVGCVEGNAAELRDALTNLLFNAVDAMPEGGAITVRTRWSGSEIMLEVEDSGTGMTEEVRQKCLEPYFTTKGLQGTGLGLSMVHGVAERHRGRMEVDSQLGRGTAMRLCLPRAEIAPAPALLEVAAPKIARRIMCVDDDVRVLEALEGMLRQLGHDVTTTSSGAEVLDRIGVESFDVLITDLGMPGMDGREVARNAKELSPDTRVLLLTGWADRLQVTGDTPAGVDKVLGKPITKAQLQQALA